MNIKYFKQFLFIVSIIIPGGAFAEGPSCGSIFAEAAVMPGLQLNNFQETMAMLYLQVGEKLTPVVLEQMSVFEKLRKIDSKVDLLSAFNIERFASPDGLIKLHWKNVDLSQPKKASAALVKMSRLIALEQFHSLRLQKGFFENIKNLKADTLQRIETEVYLKALLQAEGHYQKSSELSIFLPWNMLRTENIRIDQKMIDVLNSSGLEAFHELLVARYGWRVSAKIVQNTSKNITKIAGIISAAIIFYLYQKGDDYFNKTLMLETGLQGNDQNLFTHILKVSGLKDTREVMEWIGSQKSDDPDLIIFQQELQQELKK